MVSDHFLSRKKLETRSIVRSVTCLKPVADLTIDCFSAQNLVRYPIHNFLSACNLVRVLV